MKVAIDGTALTIPYHCGIRHYGENLIREIGKLDDGNEYVLFLPRTPFVKIPKKFKTVFFQSIPVLKRQVFLPVLVRKEKIDVIHFLEPYSSLFVFGCATVLTVHDVNLSMTYPWLGRYFLNRAWCEFTRLILFWKAKAFLVVSKSVAEELGSFFGRFCKGKPILVSHNSFDKQYFYATSQKNKQAYFLAMGDFARRKNINITLEAFAEYVKQTKENIQLKIIVSRKDFGKKFESHLRRLHIEHLVNLIYQPHTAEVANLFRGARAFLYPSLYEGFGIPILEAMACGVPVITSNYGAMKEVAGRAGYFVNPYSTASIVEAMVAMRSNSLRSFHIRKGLKRVGDFSWRKTAMNVVKLYTSAYESSK